MSIRPKKSQFLLIPVTAKNRDKVRPNDAKRGYTLAKVAEIPPGSKYTNQFTDHFLGFWETKGNEILNASVTQQFLQDYGMNKPRKSRTKLIARAGSKQNIVARLEQRKKEVQLEADLAAARRLNESRARTR